MVSGQWAFWILDLGFRIEKAGSAEVSVGAECGITNLLKTLSIPVMVTPSMNSDPAPPPHNHLLVAVSKEDAWMMFRAIAGEMTSE